MAKSRQSADHAARRRGVSAVTAYFIPEAGRPASVETCQVVEEDALTIDVDGIGSYTLMWTPTEHLEGGAGFTELDGVLAETDEPEALALAAGFAFTEGIVQGLDEIRTMAVCPDTPGVIRMEVVDPERVETRRRNVVLTSSCGVCGRREILEDNAFGLDPVPDAMRLDSTGFARLMQSMREQQAIFSRTGGAHAAAIFCDDGRILAVAEDLGRHNALDKVIGKVLLAGGDFSRCGALLSSRLSLEMVAKAVRAGLEIVAAVSAPTSLAIDVAERFGLTLCGFVRQDRATVFTGPHRISNLPQAADVDSRRQ